METGVIIALYRDPCIQVAPTLGLTVYKYHLHWAVWILRRSLPLCETNVRILSKPFPDRALLKEASFLFLDEALAMRGWERALE